MVEKRKTDSSQLVAHKKSKDVEPIGQLSTSNNSGKQVFRAIKRTSLLSQPIMQLSGHHGIVLTCQFNNKFKDSPFDTIRPLLATAGVDKSILLWNAFDEAENYGIINHTAPILQLCWSKDSSQIFTASSDHSVAIFDVAQGERIKRFRGHQGIVNSVSASRRGLELISSASDDATLKVWDAREKNPVKNFHEKLPLLATEFSRDGDIVFCAGIGNDIHAWDMRKDDIIYSLKGHSDSITGLTLSPDGDHLLSNSMDNTVSMWDIRPFCISDSRRVQSFEGAPQGFEKNLIRPCWSPNSDYVACGSGDRSVVIWDAVTGKMCYKLPGHKGCVNQVDWAGSIIASASSDQTLFLGELDLSEL